MCSSARRKRCALVGALIGMLWAQGAGASSYWEVSSSSRLLSDDNFGLSARTQANVTRFEQFLSAGVGEEDERGSWQVAIQDRFRHHTGEDDGLRTAHQPGLDASWHRALSDRSQWRVSANLLRDTTSANEFFDTEVRSDIEKTRWRRVANIEHSYWWSSRWRLQTGLSGEWLDYRDAENTGLISYDYVSAAPSLFYLLSEQTDVYLALGVDRFRPAPANTPIQQLSAVRSDTYRLTAGWRYRWAEPHELDISLGMRHSKFEPELGGRTRRDDGGLLQGLYRYQGEQYSVSLRAQRRLSPTSDGRVIEQDVVNLWADIAHSERWRSNVALQWRTERETGSDAGNLPDERSQELRAGWDYRLYAQHRVGLMLRHRRFEQNETARSNAVELQWHWHSGKRF